MGLSVTKFQSPYEQLLRCWNSRRDLISPRWASCGEKRALELEKPKIPDHLTAEERQKKIWESSPCGEHLPLQRREESRLGGRQGRTRKSTPIRKEPLCAKKSTPKDSWTNGTWEKTYSKNENCRSFSPRSQEGLWNTSEEAGKRDMGYHEKTLHQAAPRALSSPH